MKKISNSIEGKRELGAKFSQLLGAMGNTLDEFGLQDFLLSVHVLHEVVNVESNGVPTCSEVLLLHPCTTTHFVYLAKALPIILQR